ncbi:MAG TPA: hypothetical protein VEO01_18940 [Pseudonocardiaceae bacterium]|nr:hypothetical protein [Pseudonocardiaceae bacterium]
MPADLIARQGVAVTADLRAAAFGDRPDTPVFGTAADRQASPRDRWLAAVTLGGQGRYAAAAATLRDLHTGSDPLYAALAGATMASHLRQLGGHEHARRLDAAALRRLPSGRLPSRSEPDPDGVDHAGALVDALLGLAADAIGLGRVTEAARLHAAATAAAGDERVWRVTVRIDWVATEVALAAGRFGDAVPPAERAMAAARAAGAVRHTVKSTMMLGAALTSGGTPDGRSRAEGLLTDALAASLTWGMFSLAWPSASLLADLADDAADRYIDIAANALTSVFWWSDAAMRRMGAASVWLPTALIRSGEATRSSVELAT